MLSLDSWFEKKQLWKVTEYDSWLFFFFTSFCQLTFSTYLYSIYFWWKTSHLEHSRFLWIVVHIIGAVSIISILNYTLEEHMTNPFVTTLYDTAYPISKIGFPGKCILCVWYSSKKKRKIVKKKVFWCLCYTSNVNRLGLPSCIIVHTHTWCVAHVQSSY